MSDDTEESWVMYKDREEWSDLKPITQNDGPHPVVKIAYTAAFEDVFDYFRGVVGVGEVSERALQLTEDAIHLNAANYTVWQYRRRILEHLESDLQEELSFCREMIEANPKNYQVWHHRRVIVGWLQDGTKELRLTEIIFGQDAKNYHAWEHRQWVLRTFSLYDGELAYIDQLLKNDLRNNSAWNHRYFVLSRTTSLTTDVLRQELLYARDAIIALQDNESPWTYMKGLLQDTLGEECEIESCWRTTEAWCWDLFRKTSSGTTTTSGGDSTTTTVPEITSISKGSVSPHLLIGLLDCVIHRLEKLSKEEKEGPLETAVQLCGVLGSTHDTIRSRYWSYLSRQLTSSHSRAGAEAAPDSSSSQPLPPTAALQQAVA